MIIRLAVAAAILVATSYCAAAPTGVWKGTIGQAVVMVCLTDSDDSHYYYLRHRRGIRLIPGAVDSEDSHLDSSAEVATREGRFALDELAPGSDREGARSGHWALQEKSPVEVVGTWAAPQGGSKLPIVLNRIQAFGPGKSECGDAFYEPIYKAMRLSYHPAHYGARKYQTVSSKEATSLKVPTEVPGAEALNRYALGWLQEQEAFAYDCNLDLSRIADSTITLGRELKPMLWTQGYLVLKEVLPETFCGGAHGFWSISYLTWSWNRGQTVDTWAWLRGGRKALESHAVKDHLHLPSGLMRLITKLHPRNQEGDNCQEVMESMNVQPPYPTARGLVFNTSFFHAMRACGDEVSVPWKQLTPYLSHEGHAVVKQFIQ